LIHFWDAADVQAERPKQEGWSGINWGRAGGFAARPRPPINFVGSFIFDG
jgi:hypothetical protein